jgi:hypothetical protein
MKQKAATQGHGGFFAVAVTDRGYRIDYLLATVRGAVLFTSSWALTFWI